MYVHNVLHGIKTEGNQSIPKGIIVKGLSFHSSELGRNYIFTAIAGGKHDGHDYIHQAISNGAAVIVGEKRLEEQLPVPYIRVENSRKALAKMAVNFYGNPANKHIMIGITGTNGKTTTSFMLKHLVEQAGYTCTLIGSVVNIINGVEYCAKATTPDSLELNRLLDLSEDDFVIMEVSSHALSQARVEEIQFDYCLFTNLAHDHLDYHHTLEEYFNVKASLFNQLKPDGHAIINIDNEWGEKLRLSLEKKNRNVISLSQLKKGASWTIQHVLNRRYPSATLVNQNGEKLPFHLAVPGEHNLYNAAMALITGKSLGMDAGKLPLNMFNFNGVPGRFEMMNYNGITIVIDYAHTADAFNYCLTTAHQCGAKRVFHIFGFRGERDESKRGAMLQTSAYLADEYILTFDDLNNVATDRMVLTMNTLNKEYGNHKGKIIPDRTLAIKSAIERASTGDWIFITGKGNEPYTTTFEIAVNSDTETVLYLTGEKEQDCIDVVI